MAEFFATDTMRALDAKLEQARDAQRRGDFPHAVLLTDQAAAMAMPDAARLSRLAMLYFGQQRFEPAAQAYRRALRLRPGNPGLSYNLAAVLRLIGAFDEAEALCDAAIARSPRDHQALWLRSSLRRQDRDRNHLAELVAARDAARDPLARSWIGYALAKEYEDVADYDAAFAAMADAARSRRATIRYDVRQDEAVLEAIAGGFGAEAFASSRRAAAQEATGPVFIIGLPRTGTTLAERILSHGGDLRPAGELPDFAQQLVAMARERHGAATNPVDLVGQCRGIDWPDLGRRYVGAVRARYGVDGRFIDKLPLNFLYAGLIHLALPDARIVHLVRDPLDACLAIYKHPFEAFYPFSYDPAELARYHRAYTRLMAHWRAILVPRGVMMDIAYEDLVAQPETWARRLRAFCGLAWDAACLDMANNPLPVSSASAVQVPQPINARSVGSASRYGRHLGELRRLLGA